jgi:hypothetical protein
LKNIGGRYETLKSVEQPGAVYEAVPQTVQAEAMQFINQHVFKTPVWLLDKKILSLTGSYPMDIINSLQENTLGRLISPNTFGRLVNNESVYGNTYTIGKLFADLQKGVWGELDIKAPIDLYRRNLQKLYIDKMAVCITPAAANTPAKLSESTAIIRAHLTALRTKMKAVLATQQDAPTRYHLEDLIQKIDTTLSKK